MPKEKEDNWILVDGTVRIALTETILNLFGFEETKPGTYVLDGIRIKKEGNNSFYHLNKKKTKKKVATVKGMKRLFIDAKKPIPELVDF